MHTEQDAATFSGLTDLAAERVGGKALVASDEFFAPKENLLKPGRGVFIAGKYTDRGKWMDGWESRRKRGPGHDWVIIKLGLPGVIEGVDIDTNHFLGNHPPFASLDACTLPAGASLEEADWTEILPKSALRPGSQNLFAVHHREHWTHARLHIYPDGGVARLRLYGKIVPDLTDLAPEAMIDLASLAYGGEALACSDWFFSPMQNLLLPRDPINMGDGWETRRKRGPGHDWVIIKLGAPASLRRVVVDTTHFKGNYPDRCSLDACYLPGADLDALADADWRRLLAETSLQADHAHIFEDELKEIGPSTHLRLNIFPDGGVARLRAFGTMAK